MRKMQENISKCLLFINENSLIKKFFDELRKKCQTWDISISDVGLNKAGSSEQCNWIAMPPTTTGEVWGKSVDTDDKALRDFCTISSNTLK